MLPDFPKTRVEFEQLIRHRIDAKASASSVVERLMRGIAQHEGKQHTYQQDGNKMVTEGYQQIRVEISVNVDEVPTLNGEKLIEKLDKIAEDKAQQISSMFYRKMDEVTEQSGNRFDAGGKITQEMGLEMMRRSTWSPDAILLAHPTAAKAMAAAWEEWQKDPEYMRQYRELDTARREEWRARENRRKLVD